MEVKTEMFVSGILELTGSVDAVVVISGEAAVELRLDLFSIYDTGNQYLDEAETGRFIKDYSEALVHKIFWGISIDSATNFSAASLPEIREHTSGLVGLSYSSHDPIAISLSFEGTGESKSKVILAAQSAYDTFGVALRDAVGYAYNGTMKFDHRITMLGVGSFSNPELDDGVITLLRTPVGEVLWYSYEGPVGMTVQVDDTMAYNNISVTENPILAFLVVLVGSLMIMRMPGKKFDKFEKLHPRKFRKYAKPLMSVRIVALALTVVIVLLYLFPCIFSFVSSNAMICGLYLYIVVPLAVIGMHIFSKMTYDRASLSIPEESVIEIKQARIVPEGEPGEMLCKVCYRPIEAGLELLQSTCGASMHMDCAEKVKKCPVCGEELFPEYSRSIQCRVCGETFMYTGSEDAYSVQCTKCGAFQEEIKGGRNYLIVDESPRNAFMMARALVASERLAMILTTTFPGKVRADYELGDIPIKRFSDNTDDIDNVNPQDLEGDAMEMVSTFLMTTRQSGVLIDGLEELIEFNGFEKVHAFIKKVNDLAATHGSSIILYLNKTKVTEEQLRKLSEGFDETHDYQ